MMNARWTWIAVVAGAILPCLFAGCECSGHNVHGVDKCADVPAGAIPQPIGTHVKEVNARQAAKAYKDEFVIYLYEWQLGTACFGPFGSRHIAGMAPRLSAASGPVVIEPEVDAGLNEERRHGVQNAQAFVVVGFAAAEGLYGDEAPRIYRQMITPYVGGTSSGNRGNTGIGNNGIGNSGIGNNGIGNNGGIGFLGQVQ
jgi:hypothetical protein